MIKNLKKWNFACTLFWNSQNVIRVRICIQEEMCHRYKKKCFSERNRWISKNGNVLSVSFLWLNVWFSIIAWGHIFQAYPMGSGTCIAECPGRSFWFCKAHQDTVIIYIELHSSPQNRIWFCIVEDVFSRLETSQLLKLPAHLQPHLLHTWENPEPNIHILLRLRNTSFFKFSYKIPFRRRVKFFQLQLQITIIVLEFSRII